MKYKRLAVFVENKSGTFYQVGLDQREMDCVADIISQLQGGTIKVLNKKYTTLSFKKCD